jgi:low temperature requirement protein LtrA
LAHGDAREAVWAAAALIDLSTPTVRRPRLRGMQLDAGHLAERFGLFVLIALGESVVSVGTSSDPDRLSTAQGFRRRGGIRASIAHPGIELSWSLCTLIIGGAALYLASFGFTRWAMFRLVSWTRLTAAGAVLAVLPIARWVPALVTLTLLAVILIVLNTVELARVEQIGFRTLLARRGADPVSGDQSPAGDQR